MRIRQTSIETNAMQPCKPRRKPLKSRGGHDVGVCGCVAQDMGDQTLPFQPVMVGHIDQSTPPGAKGYPVAGAARPPQPGRC